MLAAVTSCTNTSHPSVMIAAGLLARNGIRRGLLSRPWVKTSLSPGSRVVEDYLARTGLQLDLNTLGFHITGYGCMTCMGNSGPLPKPVDHAIEAGKLAVASVLSGNRNFEGRIHPGIRANFMSHRRWLWPKRSRALSRSTSRANRWARAAMANRCFLSTSGRMMRKSNTSCKRSCSRNGLPNDTRAFLKCLPNGSSSPPVAAHSLRGKRAARSSDARPFLTRCSANPRRALRSRVRACSRCMATC